MRQLGFRTFILGAVAFGAAALVLSPAPSARADGGDTGDEPAGIPPETVGTWSFKASDRPVKAIVLGGSVTAWPKGNFGQFLEGACKRVEVVNRGKARIGAVQLKERFVKQVLRNRRVDPKAHEETWLLFQGGLNSIGTPEKTNKYVADIFRLAYEHGIKTVGITLGPWGAEKDKKRWAGARGLQYLSYMRLAVDFVMGRLTPAEALGDLAKGRDSAEWLPGELPTIGVDLYASELRDKDAPLRDGERLMRQVQLDAFAKRKLAEVAEGERESLLAQLVEQAREIPRYFMRKELHAFDHIHPNMEGHRVMAKAICPKLPASWGCECAAIDRLQWGKGGLQ